MSFLTSISKEDIKNLPLFVFNGTIHIIDSQQKVNDAIGILNKEKKIGFDTETKPVFKKGVVHKIALIQLATENDAFLFRINKIGFPDALIHIFENESVQKIGADINLDLKGLKKSRDFSPVGFVDIQKIAAKLNIKEISLRHLTAIVLNYRLSKRQQLSNWEKDKLTQGQLNYAAADAYICLKIYNKLQQYLNE
ncbi:MAG TPA: 3'-5' exonuclease domain-containing protein 2 [Bacteroidales bacterium]|nr:3'-5' exonuclease domain-containing protein 2 [Bacteroidales bacterium]